MPDYYGCDQCDPISLMEERVYENEDLLEFAIRALDLLELDELTQKEVDNILVKLSLIGELK